MAKKKTQIYEDQNISLQDKVNNKKFKNNEELKQTLRTGSKLELEALEGRLLKDNQILDARKQGNINVVEIIEQVLKEKG